MVSLVACLPLARDACHVVMPRAALRVIPRHRDPFACRGPGDRLPRSPATVDGTWRHPESTVDQPCPPWVVLRGMENTQKVSYEFGAATNPLPLRDAPVPAEVTRVEGCDCGGMEWHREDCSIWSMPYDDVRAAVDVAQAR